MGGLVSDDRWEWLLLAALNFLSLTSELLSLFDEL